MRGSEMDLKIFERSSKACLSLENSQSTLVDYTNLDMTHIYLMAPQIAEIETVSKELTMPMIR
ncbi:hypothetical protein RJ639_024387 [Escallonia herrerae]|uniref:Uncharacterized protein n=1 Tax=Escallonia herrerae TaxID=1293975 RepID=A0AA88V1Q8_9ASTE|nr:hypothetical protein RJ639_024387 [Escallonia herrerae]